MNLSDIPPLSEDNGPWGELLVLCGTHQRWLDEMRHARSPPSPPFLGPSFDEIPRFPPLP
jgi:hypothetical protein